MTNSLSRYKKKNYIKNIEGIDVYVVAASALIWHIVHLLKS